MYMNCEDAELRAALPEMTLVRFAAELDFSTKGLYRRPKRRVMNLKPYLQLDVTAPTAAKHAKMALRMLRPWQLGSGDPWTFSEERALHELEEFVKSGQAPRWFRMRFEHPTASGRGARRGRGRCSGAPGGRGTPTHLRRSQSPLRSPGDRRPSWTR